MPTNELAVDNQLSDDVQWVHDEDNTVSSLGISTQMVETKGDFQVGEDVEVAMPCYGKKLYLAGAGNNTDYLWLARYNYALDNTALRVNVGDNNADAADQLEIGCTYYTDNKWYPWMTVKFDNTTISNNLTVNGALEVKGSFSCNGAIGLSQIDMNKIKPRSQAPAGADIEQLLIDKNTGMVYYE